MKYNDNGTYKDIYVKTFDTLPVGTIIDYDGDTVPENYEIEENILWENEDTTVDFGEETITLNNSNYDELIWYMKLEKNVNTIVTVRNIKETNAFSQYVSGYSQQISSRNIVYQNATSYSFGHGFKNGAINDSTLIPVKVVGINKKIKKTSQYIKGGASLSNTYGTSNENGYTQEYINNLETYSTDEIRIGTWIDGKPLYRKLLTLGALKNNGETTVNYDSTYIIQKFDAYVENPTINIKFKLPVPGTNYISAFDYKTSNYIAVQTSSDRTAFTDNYVIIEYTKTTD